MSAKSEMRTHLLEQKNQKDAVTLSFTQAECTQLEWENHSEFGYEGEMYDVIESRNDGDHILVRCIADSKETALLQDYQKNSKRDPFHSVIAQMITASFLLPKEDGIARPEVIYTNEFVQYSISLPTGINTVVCPPPDVC